MKAQRRIAHRLLDIVDAIDNIRTALEGCTFETFRTHSLIRPAVERYFEILCEASRHVPENVREANPDIPWRKVADLGNVLRHAYFNTDPAILWDIYANHLDQLEAVVRRAQRDFPDVDS